jgi:PAS domain S-box-containing protein
LKTILLVEDDAIIALAEAMTITGFGYRVLTASSGEAAVELACREDQAPDLVLMDLDLGQGMDGTEAARRILEARNLPIVFLTAHSERECVEKVRNITRYGYVVKNSGNFVLQSSIELAFELFEAKRKTSESEARLRALLKAIPDLVWLKDTEGVYLACNHSFERFFNAPESEIVGKKDYDFLEKELAEFFIGKDRAAIELGAPSVNEEWITFADNGQRALLETIKTPLFDARGLLVGVLGIGRDITERKRMEEALLESERSVRQKLNAIIEPEGDLSGLGISDVIDIPTLNSLMEDFSALTGMVIAILDIEGKILVATGWQDACTKFHRANPKSAAACTESDLFLAGNVRPGECVDYRCKNNLWDIVTPLYIGERHVGNIYSGQFFYDEDVVDEGFFASQAGRLGFDKEEYLDAIRRVPRFSHEQIARLMNYLVRLTEFVSRLSYSNLELARSTAQRRRAEEQLRKSVEEKEILLKELQHRVKNSLGLVSSLLSLNMAELSDESSRRAFQEASDRIRSVGMVYEELSVSASASEINLGRYLAELIELLAASYMGKDERISVKTEMEDIDCDPKRAVWLGLVLTELLTNALKYAYPTGKGEIRVGLSLSEGWVELRVSDDGPGLPPGFDPQNVKSLGLRLAFLLTEDLEGQLSFGEGPGARALLRFEKTTSR